MGEYQEGGWDRAMTGVMEWVQSTPPRSYSHCGGSMKVRGLCGSVVLVKCLYF